MDYALFNTFNSFFAEHENLYPLYLMRLSIRTEIDAGKHLVLRCFI